MSEDIRHNYEEVEKLAGRFDAHASHLHSEGGQHLSDARHRFGRTRGKGGLAQAAESGVEKLVGSVGKAQQALTEHLKKVSQGLHQTNSNHRGNDASVARTFDKPSDGSVPKPRPALPAAPERPALPPGKGKLSLQQVRNTRDKRKRWEAGEDHVRQQYGGGPERAYPVATNRDPQFPVTKAGGRKVDVPVDLPDGRTLAVEVKTYQQYRSVEVKPGEFAPKYFEVPLSSHIREQIAKDVALRRTDPGYDPRWVFLHATPSQDLRDHLSNARIIFVEHHIPKKK